MCQFGIQWIALAVVSYQHLNWLRKKKKLAKILEYTLWKILSLSLSLKGDKEKKGKKYVFGWKQVCGIHIHKLHI